MDDEVIKNILSLNFGNLIATSFVAAFLCEKNAIDKSELAAYLRRCKEINLDDVKDRVLAESICDALDKISSTMEAMHQPLDESNTSGSKY